MLPTRSSKRITSGIPPQRYGRESWLNKAQPNPDLYNMSAESSSTSSSDIEHDRTIMENQVGAPVGDEFPASDIEADDGTDSASNASIDTTQLNQRVIALQLKVDAEKKDRQRLVNERLRIEREFDEYKRQHEAIIATLSCAPPPHASVPPAIQSTQASVTPAIHSTINTDTPVTFGLSASTPVTANSFDTQVPDAYETYQLARQRACESLSRLSVYTQQPSQLQSSSYMPALSAACLQPASSHVNKPMVTATQSRVTYANTIPTTAEGLRVANVHVALPSSMHAPLIDTQHAAHNRPMSVFPQYPFALSQTLPNAPPAIKMFAAQPSTVEYGARSSFQVNGGHPAVSASCPTAALPPHSMYANTSVPFAAGTASSYAQHSWPPPPNHFEQQFGAPPSFMPFQPFGARAEYQMRYEQRRLHDLPIFSGKPEEWPMFSSTYINTTRAYGYSQLENVTRLQKSLVGNAKQAVECLLIHPQHVDMAMGRLEALYGRPEQLVRSQIRRARELPNITEERIVELVPFATSVQNLAMFLDAPSTQYHLIDPTLLEELVRKLPMARRMAWAAEAARLGYHPSITDFARWVTGIADLIGLVSYDADQAAPPSKAAGKPANRRHVLLSVSREAERETMECVSCGGDHDLERCDELAKMNVDDRWAVVRAKGVCYGCLQYGHILPSCDRKRQCGLDGCGQWHHRKLHYKKATEEAAKQRVPMAAPSGQSSAVTRRAQSRRYSANKAQRTHTYQPTSPAPAAPRPSAAEGLRTSGADPVPAINHCREMERKSTLFRVVPVTIHGRNDDVSTFALLDEGSSITLIDADLANQLGIQGPSSELNVQWFSSDSSEQESMTVAFDITGQQSGCERFSMENVRTVKRMDLPAQSVDAAALLLKCPHLREIPLSEYANAKPKLLIGLDHHFLGVPTEIRTDPERRSLVAAKTPLGWVLYGSDGPTPQARPAVLHVRNGDDDRYELLNQLVLSHFSTESFGTKMPKAVLESEMTTRARKIMKETTRRIEHDRFETGLLWKSPDTRLPESFNMALRRLRSVEARMRREPKFGDQYRAQIDAYVKKGYARRLTDVEARQRTNRTWFLPHFAVFNDNKPGKFRLVFDAAAEVDGVSLNSELLSGPDDNNALLKLLMQFRVGQVGIVADIREMFHQVRIREADQMAQRFLWRSGDSSVEPSVYVMTAMTFGATCSPASAQHVKNINAAEFADEFPDAAAAIQTRHYVDDYVASYTNATEAAKITADVVKIHNMGGFELRGFVSNSTQTLELIGAAKGSGDDNAVSMEFEAKDSEKVLGMWWNTAADVFQFRTKFVRVHPDVLNGTRTPTKREVLSVSMSLFDPYGLLADFTLEPKLIVQDLWRIKVGWDEPAPEHLAKRWESWRREVERTKLLRVPRCYSRFILTSDDVQLHLFADASEAAFSAVAYWRVVHAGGVDVSFVLGRTRCAPLQPLSIPRLELQAALLATRLLTEIRDTHPNIALRKVVLWSDSTTVLSWLHSDQRKYKPFVQVRVGEILETVSAESWRWVPTALNVADDATRVQRPITFRTDGRWTRGPEWLRLGEDEWPTRTTASEPNAADQHAPEEIRSRFVGLTTQKRSVFEYDRCSTFRRLCNVAALVQRFVNNLRSRTSVRITGPLDAQSVESAMLLLCRMVQHEVYGKEIEALKRNEDVEKSSPLYVLKPYVEADGLLRMRGRTDAADKEHLPFDACRPILLPRSHRFTWLLVQQQHEKSAHQLTNATIVAIRRRFWIPQIRTLLKSVRARCVVCKRRHAEPVPPIQGQLPADRLTPYSRPFTNTGLDYFGPVNVTVGRRKEKRWVAVFTCLAIRAVHLEVAADLTTDACLVCVRNLCHVRGTPSRIRCDNGTNFVGARNTLANQDGFLDADSMQRELCATGIQWVMNCAGNPEAGGVWERMVQAVKKILAVTLKDEAPHVETLRAHLLEAANMLNSRPLTHIPISPDDNDALTPNHFLIGGPNSVTMTDPMDAEPAWVRSQWRKCRELSRRFWKQWVDEYLPELTRRSKNYPERKELDVGDIVIVCDSSQPRGRWPLGRIVSVTTGPDGRVRTAEVRTKDGTYRRPVARLAVLEIGPDSE